MDEISGRQGKMINSHIPQSEALDFPGTPKLASCCGNGKYLAFIWETAGVPEIYSRSFCVVGKYLE